MECRKEESVKLLNQKSFKLRGNNTRTINFFSDPETQNNMIEVDWKKNYISISIYPKIKEANTNELSFHELQFQ